MGTSVNVHKYNNVWAYCSVDSKLGYIQLKYLSPDNYAALESGDSGAAVTSLEKALLNLGYYDGNPGTSYNADTVTAVERFQEACGMTVTGMADPETLEAIYAEDAPRTGAKVTPAPTPDDGSVTGEAIEALMALGYQSSEAAAAVAAINPLPDRVDEVIRLALKGMVK